MLGKKTMNDSNERMEARFTEHLLYPGPMLTATEARDTIESQGATHGGSIWESSLSVFCLSSSSSSVRSWIKSSRFWEYFSNIRSIESATLVFLPWLMLLNWRWDKNPNSSVKLSTFSLQLWSLGHRNEPDTVPVRRSWVIGDRVCNRRDGSYDKGKHRKLGGRMG